MENRVLRGIRDEGCHKSDNNVSAHAYNIKFQEQNVIILRYCFN